MVLRVTYGNRQLLLPESAAVGLAVHVRALTSEAEVRQRAAIVVAQDDGTRDFVIVHGPA